MPQKPTRKKVKMNLTPAYVSSTLSMATRNLINMVAVTAFSGAVRLGFWPPGIFEQAAFAFRGYGALVMNVNVRKWISEEF
jgi:hypothetical protein